MISSKRVWVLLLLALVFGGGLVVFGANRLAKPPVSDPIPSIGIVLGNPPQTAARTLKIADLIELPKGTVNHVEVVYFHRTERCESCLNAENYTRETIEKYFADQVQRNLISLRVLDVEKAENAALVQKFDAAGSALYVGVLIQDTEYLCPIQDVWFYTTNKYLFVDTLKKKLGLLVGGL